MSENSCADRFLRIDGGNGATFFFSAATFADWQRSLEFYRTVSGSTRLKKALLTGAFPMLKLRAHLSGTHVGEAISAELNLPDMPAVGKHASAMISSPRNKAIVHHHGVGYEKFAEGSSFPGVVRELELYGHFAQIPPHRFAVSSISGATKAADWVRFQMNYASGCFTETVPPPASLVEPLAEFFRYGTGERVAWDLLYGTLLENLPELEALVPEEARQGEILLGLVHRDFKSWNVKAGNRPLFFDFEAASFAGCPLEDLFNYLVAPLIRRSPAGVMAAVRRQGIPLAEALLRRLSVPVAELPRCWRWYRLERMVFWQQNGQPELAKRFGKLDELA